MHASTLTKVSLILFLCFLNVGCVDVRFQVQESGPSSFEVRWLSKLPNEPTKQFRITVQGVLDDDCKKPVVQGWSMCKISDKYPNTRYTCQLQICPMNAVSPNNCLNASKSMPVYTPPEAPAVLIAKALDNETIKLSWQIPQQNTDGLQTYAKLQGKDAPPPSVQVTQIGINSATFTNLRALTEYNATLSLYSTLSSSSSALVKATSVVTFPNAPTGILITGVGATWIKALVEPAPGSENFPLSYTIRAESSSKTAEECVAQIFPEGAICTIEGLESGAIYSLTAKACHGSDCSVASSQVLQKTKAAESDGLKLADIIGIVIGASVGVLLLIVICVCICKKSKP
ncbi:hypothetical protein SprV_0802562200 [Sparganum proliferum]